MIVFLLCHHSITSLSKHPFLSQRCRQVHKYLCVSPCVWVRVRRDVSFHVACHIEHTLSLRWHGSIADPITFAVGWAQQIAEITAVIATEIFTFGSTWHILQTPSRNACD